MTYSKGDRVRLSQAGREITRRHAPSRMGTVTNDEKYHCVSVRWDGNKTAGRLHRDFVERIDGELTQEAK